MGGRALPLVDKVNGLLCSEEGRRDWPLCSYDPKTPFSRETGWGGWSRIWRLCRSLPARTGEVGKAGFRFAQRHKGTKARCRNTVTVH
jgi:hypothetical protein